MKKKTIKIIIIVLSSILALLVLAGLLVCRQNASQDEQTPDRNESTTESPSEIIEVESIRILLESYEFVIGTRFWPRVIIQPENATDKSFELHSDNELILRQQGNNWVAADVGTAKLVATASNGISGTVTITVLAPDLQALSFMEEEIIIELENSVLLSPVRTPFDARLDEPLIYTSDDENVVTVSDEGRITAVGAGNTIVRVSAGELSAEIKITVIVPVSSISIIMDRHIFSIGDQAEFRIEVEPENATNASISVSFSGASITETGENTFICNAAGEVAITFTAENGRSATQIINVYDLEELAEEVHRLTNTERINAGLSQVGKFHALTHAAVLRARESIIRLDEDHRRPDGREFFTVLDDGSIEYSTSGENLAAGQTSAAEVVQAWMDSPGHRRNILSGDFGRMGAGVAMDNTGRIYWSQLFMD